MLEDIDTIIYREKCKKRDLNDLCSGINFQWRHCNDLMKILNEKTKGCAENASLRIIIHITKEKNKYIISYMETTSKWGFVNYSDDVNLPDLEISESEIFKNIDYCCGSNMSMTFINRDGSHINMIYRLTQKINFIVDIVSNLS